MKKHFWICISSADFSQFSSLNSHSGLRQKNHFYTRSVTKKKKLPNSHYFESCLVIEFYFFSSWTKKLKQFCFLKGAMDHKNSASRRWAKRRGCLGPIPALTGWICLLISLTSNSPRSWRSPLKRRRASARSKVDVYVLSPRKLVLWTQWRSCVDGTAHTTFI